MKEHKMRLIPTLILSALFLTNITQAAPQSEAEVYAYRNTMTEVGEALKNDQTDIAFQKVKPLAEQGFAEAQYVLATLYAEGVRTDTNPDGNPELAEAERWYEAAAQNNNAEVAKLAQEALSEMH